MKKFNRNYIFIALIVICIGLLVWLKPGKNYTLSEREGGADAALAEQESAAASSESEDDMADNTEDIAEKHSIEVPSGWKEEINEHNSIDAVVTVPDSIRESGFRAAKAESVDINQEQTLAFLEDYYQPYKEKDDEYVLLYLGNDDMWLYFFKAPYNSGLEASMMTTFYHYIRVAYREGTYDSNWDLYPIDEELENFSIDDCDNMIMELCRSAGLDGEINIVHRTLDYRMMKNEALEMNADGTYTKPDYQWTPADNSYYCTIFQSCNGISVIPIYITELKNEILELGAHNCIVNRGRVVMFSIGEIYDIRYEDGYEDLMEFADIVEKYKQYATLSRQDYKTVVTDIAMRVCAVAQDDGSYDMIPLWIFKGYWSMEEGTEEESTGSHAIVINAITGERL